MRDSATDACSLSGEDACHGAVEKLIGIAEARFAHQVQMIQDEIDTSLALGGHLASLVQASAEADLQIDTVSLGAVLENASSVKRRVADWSVAQHVVLQDLCADLLRLADLEEDAQLIEAFRAKWAKTWSSYTPLGGWFGETPLPSG